MPPRRQIIVDPSALLRRLSEHVATRRSEIERELADLGTEFTGDHRDRQTWWDRVCELRAELKDITVVPYDLGLFSGKRSLTDSEKQRWRQAVRELEDARLLKVYGDRATHVQLTKRGRDRVAELSRP